MTLDEYFAQEDKKADELKGIDRSKLISMEELCSYSKSTLKHIYKSANYWGWPFLLGEMPDDWDELPNYQKPWMADDVKTKEDIIRPYMRKIREIVGASKL